MPNSIYRPFSGGVASRLATPIYVAMVTPILYDNSYSPIVQKVAITIELNT